MCVRKNEGEFLNAYGRSKDCAKRIMLNIVPDMLDPCRTEIRLVDITRNYFLSGLKKCGEKEAESFLGDLGVMPATIRYNICDTKCCKAKKCNRIDTCSAYLWRVRDEFRIQGL